MLSEGVAVAPEADALLGEGRLGGARCSSWRGLLTWANRGSWAVADQGLFALSHFAANVLLARWLDPAAFGAYATAYAVFLLLATVHTAFVTEPVLVHGVGKYAGRFSAYIRAVMRTHWIVAGLIALALAGAAGIARACGQESLARLFAALALVSPLLLVTWLLRRACFARLRPRDAAAGGLVYLVMILGQLALARSAGWLGASVALVAMGTASVVTSVFLMVRARRGDQPSGVRVDHREAGRDHWLYGRWSLAVAALMWIPGNLAYCLIPLWTGFEESGLLKALMNLAMPMFQATSAVASLLIPALVAARQRAGTAALRRGVSRCWLLLCVASAAYCAFLGTVGGALAGWLYGERYAVEPSLFLLTGLLPFGAGAVALMGAALRSLERVKDALGGAALAAGVMATVGSGLIMVDGVRGAFIGYLAATLSGAAAMGWSYLRVVRETDR